MPEPDAKIAELEARLDGLVRTQIEFQNEISTIRRELTNLRGGGQPLSPITEKPAQAQVHPAAGSAVSESSPHPQPPLQPGPFRGAGAGPERTHSQHPGDPREYPPPTLGKSQQDTQRESGPSTITGSNRGNLEKFVGRSLIAFIGIAILVLGVGIGAKYAIDNGWISPLLRISLGYAVGAVLLGTAIWLKPRYLNFSAVLLSGAMAVAYFVTYFAHANYSLIPQSVAFLLMAVFTLLTVGGALLYSRQVIAHIGLVGAYAVPFLLSDDSGRFLFFFSYIAIVNCGILVIAVRKYWRSLYYAGFVFTWLIFGTWFLARYTAGEHFYLALTFSALFFGIFYLVGMAYRLRSDRFGFVEAGLIFADSFVFYAFTYAIVDSREELREYEGLMTAGHALLHLVAAQAISRLKPAAIDVVQVLTVLIVVFVTIAIPVQFNGNAVTLVWTAEAAALFWYGRKNSVPLFEGFSYPLMVLATCSLLADWIESAVHSLAQRPLVNGDFVTAVVFVAACAFIYYVNRKTAKGSALGGTFVEVFRFAVAIVGLLALYNVFRLEIGNYFHLAIAETGSDHFFSSMVEPSLTRRVDDLVRFNLIWQLNYTLAFLLSMMAVNLKWLRSAIVAFAGIFLAAAALFVFGSVGMYLLYELRVSYMSPDGDAAASMMNIAIRYISYFFAGSVLAGIYLTGRSRMIADKIPAVVREVAWLMLLNLTTLVVTSCELINLMAQMHVADGDRLGLSVLWGVHALVLIAIGIAWNKKGLRVSAIVLLAITLVKLFIYDVADLPTIPKTILFVSLGTLLLIVSFLYNKFAVRIFDRSAGSDQ